MMRKRRSSSQNNSKDGDQNGPFRHYVRKPPKARQLELFALQQHETNKDNKNENSNSKIANGIIIQTNDLLNNNIEYIQQTTFELNSSTLDTNRNMSNDYESTDSLFDEERNNCKINYFEEEEEEDEDRQLSYDADNDQPQGKSRRKNSLASLNSCERNMRRLESNERERMRMHR